MKNLSIFLLFFLVTITNSYAQKQNPNRVEVEISGGNDDYYLLPVGEQGVLLYGESDKSTKEGMPYDFTLYNSSFVKEWEMQVVVKKRQELIKQYYDSEDNVLYLMMSKKKKGFAGSDFQVLALDIENKASKIINGVLPKRIFINDFYANKDVVYFGGGIFPPAGDAFLKQTYSLFLFYIPTFFGSMNYKVKPLLYQVDFNKMKASPVFIDPKGSSKITSISVDKETKTTNAFLTQKFSKEDIRFSMLTFNEEGEKTESIPLKINSKYDITSGKVLSYNKNEKIIIGTYNLRPKRYKESYLSLQQTLSTTSTGIFYAKISDGSQEFIKTYPFSKFTNFYSYLSQRSKNRMTKKIAKKEAKGKDYNPEYNMLFHNLIKINDEMIMVAEAYYPEYETRCQTVYNSNGTSSQRCYTVFVGFRFTHAILAGFDTDGNMTWDNSFQIMDVLTYDLKPKVKYLIEGEEILLLYSYGGEIKSTVVAGKAIIEGKTRVAIETGETGDKVRQNYGSGIEHWYDNYFIAYGYQRIKNTASSGKSRRKVFYFNKIAYE